MQNSHYSQLKTLFVERRKAFKADPRAQDELRAYERGDDAYEYTILTGFVPRAVVGNVFAGERIPYKKSDTFFTDFYEHFPDRVLSATTDSLIIGNRSSPDIRQYLDVYNAEHKDMTASAGMSYMHVFVIPRRRVYNAVALDDVTLIGEMISHFRTFWTTPGSVQKCIDWIQSTIDRREDEVIKGVEANPDVLGGRKEEFKKVMVDVRKAADELSKKLDLLTVKDFTLGFHPAPDHSIGHLHMHVFPSSHQFRQHSTNAHDWKTIPIQVVREVICEDEDSA